MPPKNRPHIPVKTVSALAVHCRRPSMTDARDARLDPGQSEALE